MAVLGGGISGLAGAYQLHRRLPDAELMLFEASDRLGGVIRSERDGEYLFEHGPDMFTAAQPGAVELCRELGVEDRLVGPRAEGRRAFIVSRGRLVPVPEGFLLMRPTRLVSVLRTPLLSARGKLRLMAEPLVAARRDGGDESLEAFAVRRVGREAFEWLVQPLVAGIYTADPQRLSMDATMRPFVEMERRYGSLFRGTWAQRRRGGEAAARAAGGARYAQFQSFSGGMEELVTAVAGALPPGAVRLRHRATRVARGQRRRWRIDFAEGEGEEFDALLFALPTPAAAGLLRPLAEPAARALEEIRYASSAVVMFAVRRDEIRHPLDGFGFVVPEVERRPILAGSFLSRKFPGRAPNSTEVIRVFVGGALHPELVDREDAELERLAAAQLAELIGWSGRPLRSRVVRWRGAMPQYHVGHLQRVETVRRELTSLAGLALAGNGLEGVGVPLCIAAARRQADRLAESLASGTAGPSS